MERAVLLNPDFYNERISFSAKVKEFYRQLEIISESADNLEDEIKLHFAKLAVLAFQLRGIGYDYLSREMRMSNDLNEVEGVFEASDADALIKEGFKHVKDTEVLVTIFQDIFEPMIKKTYDEQIPVSFEWMSSRIVDNAKAGMLLERNNYI